MNDDGDDDDGGGEGCHKRICPSMDPVRNGGVAL